LNLPIGNQLSQAILLFDIFKPLYSAVNKVKDISGCVDMIHRNLEQVTDGVSHLERATNQIASLSRIQKEIVQELTV